MAQEAYEISILNDVVAPVHSLAWTGYGVLRFAAWPPHHGATGPAGMGGGVAGFAGVTRWGL